MVSFPSGAPAGFPPSTSPPPAPRAAAGHASPSGWERPADTLITTPAGSTIEPIAEGGYRICDSGHHCRRTSSLWEAQQLVQWAEVHHLPIQEEGGSGPGPIA